VLFDGFPRLGDFRLHGSEQLRLGELQRGQLRLVDLEQQRRDRLRGRIDGQLGLHQRRVVGWVLRGVDRRRLRRR
jgi:hypothetical protein